MGIDSARWEEPKTGLPVQIGHQEGIPVQWSPKSPYMYLQYTTQSVCPHIPPGSGYRGARFQFPDFEISARRRRLSVQIIL